MRAIWPALRRIPSPQSSTPQLLETTLSCLVPDRCSASIRPMGMPHRPKPPTAIDAASGMSATAVARSATTLFMSGESAPGPVLLLPTGAGFSSNFLRLHLPRLRHPELRSQCVRNTSGGPRVELAQSLSGKGQFGRNHPGAARRLRKFEPPFHDGAGGRDQAEAADLRPR